MKYLLLSMVLVGCSPKFKIGDCIMQVDNDFDPPLWEGHIYGTIISINNNHYYAQYAVQHVKDGPIKIISEQNALKCPE